jgi:acetyltransferase-like isoleucine patch superfamily enzyme
VAQENFGNSRRVVLNFKSVIRKLFRSTRRSASVGNGQIDFSYFQDAVDFYRSKGSKIGNKVRLLGQIDGVNPHLVSIGDYSVIGAHSALLAHCPIRGGLACTVGDYVYIGYGALILPGVKIGDHSIVGAGSVVTRDVPPGCIVAGNPAKILRQLSDAEYESIATTMDNEEMFGWTPVK